MSCIKFYPVRTVVFFFFITLLTPSYSQRINWKEGPDETFVFEISNKEAIKLLDGKNSRSIVLDMLHSPRGSFNGTWVNMPDKGHFIFASIHKNEIFYHYSPVIPFQVFLFKEYGVLTLQVVDNNGNIRNNAKIKLNRSRIYYDRISQTYTVEDNSNKSSRLLTVELDGFQAIFDLEKHFVNPYWNNNNNDDDKPDFYSYLITDKNKYKPGETVRFKSYALTGGRRPIKNDLEIWMRTSNRNYTYKKVGVVSPHHPGGFAGEIHLHDSLKLTLDQNYYFNLRDRKGRIVAGTSFKYEDYELYDSNLDIKLSNTNHYYPNTNKLEIMATDANGLFLPDMRAEVSVLRRNVLKSYTDILILPDTLLSQRIDLDSQVPTVVDIPASLFDDSDCSYEINVNAFSTDNVPLQKRAFATFYRSNYDLLQTTRGDKVRFAFYELGVEKKVEAEMSYDNGKVKKRISLPYEEKFNQSLNKYNIRVLEPDFQKTFGTGWMRTGLELIGGIEDGKLDLELSNPLGLEFTWYAYEGNTMIQKGAGKKFDFVTHKNIDETKTYYVEIFYFMGGEEKAFRRTYSAQPEHLRMEVDLPERIYPGQEVTSTITVKDYNGKPLSKVDLTAFAYNSLLNYYVPDLPYYGDSPEGREQRVSYSMSRKTFSYRTKMNYDHWRDKVGLDDLEYYRFTYPRNKIFTYEVNTPDSVTQFAPYVMHNGEAVKIWAIEKNDKPIYFLWTDQPKTYSFLAEDSAKFQKITLRLHDRAIVFDSIRFTPGKKTILSVDMNYLPREVITLNLGSYLRNVEKERFEGAVARFPVPKQTDNTYFVQGKDSFLIYQSCFNPGKKSILAGPIPQGYSRYNGNVYYKHSGGYSYIFEDNIVYREKEPLTIPSSFTFTTSTDFSNINDFYLSPFVLNNIIKNCKRGGFIWHPRSISISQQQMNINLRLPIEKDSTGVSNLLFQQVDSGLIVFPDRMEYGRRKYSNIPYGTYNVIVLYNNGKYLKQDSIPLNKNSFIDLNMSSLKTHPGDSLSQKWLLLGAHSAEIAQRTLINTYWDTEAYLRQTFHQSPSSGKTTNVTGYVFDSDGEPIIGASVVVKGTTRGTITNIDGYFTIDIDSENDILMFMYIGFKTKEIKVSSQTQLSVVLEEDYQTLDEVVVVGYGTSRKSSITGSVSTVSADTPPPPAEEIDETDDDVDIKAAEDKLYNELLSINGLRRNFSDVGFWEPRLYTDKKGKAQFTVTFPDNITKWNAVVYAMNRKLQTGTIHKSIRSYKPLMAELKTPQFLTVGDSSYYVGTIRNYTKDAVIHGKAVFNLANDTLMNKEVSLGGLRTDKLLVKAGADKDTITTQYIFTRDDGYMDGEERSIAIVPQGTELAKGTLSFLRNGDITTVTAEPNEEIYISITGKQLDVYVDAANYLKGYEYACNEQLASKLIGLLNYKLYASFIGEEFEYDKNVNEIIIRLLGNQNEERLWSWWGRSSGTSYWMSAHILRALNMAKSAGYEVNLNTRDIENKYKHWTPYRGVHISDIETLHAISEFGMSEDYIATVDTLAKVVRWYETREDSIAKKKKYYRPRSFLKEKLMLWEIQQQHQIASVQDSLKKYLKEDVFGAVSCEDGKQEYSWYSNSLQTTLIAYRMIKRDSSLIHLKEPMQMYILGSKRFGWNTYQASSALATVMPDILAEGASKDRMSTINLTGKINGKVTEFPYQTTLTGGEKLQIEKQEGTPLIYSAYSYKRVTEANSSKAFEITTETETETLTAGVPVKLKVSIDVKQKGAEHVMIEVPIPAGCSYASKRNYYYYYGGVETHREHFKEKTVIFCEKMPEGKYEFIIELLPRFTGSYILNPAKVEMMYQPVINANNDMIKVSIGDR